MDLIKTKLSTQSLFYCQSADLFLIPLANNNLEKTVVLVPFAYASQKGEKAMVGLPYERNY